MSEKDPNKTEEEPFKDRTSKVQIGQTPSTGRSETKSDAEQTAVSSVSSFHRYRKKLEGDVGRVLSPEHPLLGKFQNALKEQLLRQIDSLKDEIYENETGAKKKNIEREELGVEAYEYQQIIGGQQAVFEKCMADLTTLTAAKEELEHELEVKTKIEKVEREILYECERQELQLRSEIEGTHLLVRQMNEWEQDVETNIAVNKTISEKTRKDRLKLAEEKRRQDGIIYKLMTEIWRLENELEHMDAQLRVKETEREELAQSVALGNTNIQALVSEHKALMHSWNSVLVAIGNKDKTINCIRDELRKLNEKIKSVIAEISKVKKLINKEMMQNENLTMIKNRCLNDIKWCKMQISAEMIKKERLDGMMCELQAIIDQSEKDIQRVLNENNQHKATLKVLTTEYDKLYLKKTELEQKIMLQLESNVTDNKAVINVCAVLNNSKRVNRAVEISVYECENKSAQVLLEYEVVKVELEGLNSSLEETRAVQDNLVKLADRYADEQQKLDFYISKRQRVMDNLNTKYGSMMFGNTEGNMNTQFEVKKIALEKNIVEIQERIKDMQKFWLREQRNLVDLSEQRQEQIKNINLLRKQILILEQKNLKMNDEMETHKKIEERVSRNVHNMHNKMTMLCDALCKKKGMKQLMDKGNEVMEQEYVSRLKDAELECLKIQADIAEIEDDKMNLSKELIEMNREALEWEKKLILTKETKQNMMDEQNSGGEVNTMKAEIHRMQIRYSQLQKAQDKLIQDLEHCVARRDTIFSVAEARSKKSKAGSDSTRLIFSRKMDDIKNRIKQAENEVEKMEKNLKDVDQKLFEAFNEVASIEEDICMMEGKLSEVKIEVDENESNKRMNFELLVLKQRKLNMYVDISKNRTPYTLYRTESTLTSEYAKQKDLNTKLCIIMANLLVDFPNHQIDLNRMLNTLKVAAFIIHT